MVKIYGIPNCDSVKKAMSWLQKNKIPFVFHDFKKEEISRSKINEWLAVHPLEMVFNKRSTAWKALSPEEQDRSATKAGAIQLMIQYNNLIKRPVAEISGTILIGFSDTSYKKAFQLS